jgi:hypothetical protein
MALPFLFANVSSATGANLDADFAALGNLCVLPCTVAGTNTLTLTLNANTPTLSAYSNYMVFVGISSAANTSAVTAQVGALSALPVYKDTIAGPAALTGGEFVANNSFLLTYDSVLNSGSGGFHMSTAPTAIVLPVIGSASRLLGSAPGGTATATWTDVELVAETTVSGLAVKGANMSLSFNGAATGAGGMDTGAIPTSANLAVYAIYNPVTNNWNTLGYASGVSTVASQVYPGVNAPSGYTYSALIWTGVTDSSAHLPLFNQVDRSVYIGPTSVMTAAAAAPNTYYSQSLSVAVPYSATAVWGHIAGTTSSTNLAAAVYANSSGAHARYAVMPYGTDSLDGYYAGCSFERMPLITPRTIYWKSGNTTNTINISISGYQF